MLAFLITKISTLYYTVYKDFKTNNIFMSVHPQILMSSPVLTREAKYAALKISYFGSEAMN